MKNLPVKSGCIKVKVWCLGSVLSDIPCSWVQNLCASALKYPLLVKCFSKKIYEELSLWAESHFTAFSWKTKKSNPQVEMKIVGESDIMSQLHSTMLCGVFVQPTVFMMPITAGKYVCETAKWYNRNDSSGLDSTFGTATMKQLIKILRFTLMSFFLKIIFYQLTLLYAMLYIMSLSSSNW